MSEQHDETAVWPSSPSALVDTQSCPSCFHPLTAMTCAHCGLVVADPRALRLLELGRTMVQLEAQRQQIIGEIRLTHAHAARSRAGGAGSGRGRPGQALVGLPFRRRRPAACRRSRHARSGRRWSTSPLPPARPRPCSEPRRRSLPRRHRSRVIATAPDAGHAGPDGSRAIATPGSAVAGRSRRPLPTAPRSAPAPAHRAGAAAHRRRLARRHRRDLLPDPRVDGRRHRHEVAHHRRRHPRDDGRRVAAAAVVVDRDRRGHRRPSASSCSPWTAGRHERTISSAARAWMPSSTPASSPWRSASCAAPGPSSRGCAAPDLAATLALPIGLGLLAAGLLPLETSAVITIGLLGTAVGGLAHALPAPWSAARSGRDSLPGAHRAHGHRPGRAPRRGRHDAVPRPGIDGGAARRRRGGHRAGGRLRRRLRPRDGIEPLPASLPLGTARRAASRPASPPRWAGRWRSRTTCRSTPSSSPR